MKTNGLLLTVVMMVIILACGSQPNNIPTSSPTQTPVSSPTLTESPTSLPTLTLTSTSQPTLTATIANIPTNTSLPPLPDFEQVVTFALGGGARCSGARLPQTHVDAGRGGGVVCFKDTLGPLHIDWFAPDGRIFISSVDTTSLIEHDFSWPLNIPPGQWRLHAYGNGYSEIVDFVVSDERSSFPQIAAIDERSTINSPGKPLKENGNLDVVGINYPPNTPIYIVIYRHGDSRFEYRLVHNQVVLSDPNGLIFTELQGVFEVGEAYLLVGITDPHVTLAGDENRFNSSLPFDYFGVVPWEPASSCPGAPPQRMIINQRGSVCTQGDNVRLRDAPQKSANEITSLPVGSQFTVKGGPVCSDNWSWWQIRTDNGNSGWISEGGDQTDPYFICPLP